MSDNFNKFLNWIRSGVLLPYNMADIKDTGGKSRLIRSGDDKGGEKTLYYSYTEDGKYAWGRIYSCRSAESYSWYNKAERGWTESEKKEFAELKKRHELEAAKELKDTHDRVAAESLAHYNKLTIPFDHPYANKKQIPIDEKIREDGERLVIPAYDFDGKLWTYQSIDSDGGKKFVYQGKKEGTFFPLGWSPDGLSIPEGLILCEGWATGQTINLATNRPICVCWDAANIMAVAKTIGKRWPDKSITIGGDDDQWSFISPRPKQVAEIDRHKIDGDDSRWDVWRNCGYLYNKGRDIAIKAGAVLNGAYVVFPDMSRNHKDKPTDFNDAFILMGKEYVNNKFTMSPIPEIVDVVIEPIVVEHDSPSPYAPAIGDEIMGVSEHLYDYSDPEPEKQLTRSDGNPQWFDDMIWDKEPSGLLVNKFAIKGLHDGKSLNNLITFIRGAYAGLFVLNEFSDEIIVRVKPPWMEDNEPFYVHAVNDADRINMASYLEWFGFKVSDKQVEKAIIAIAEKDKIHPVKTYFNNLIWDNIPRLDNWLIDYTGSVQYEEYLRSIGSKWLMAGVARIFDAGCQFSHMLVLEGNQDIGKSAMLRELATFGDDIRESYFTDNISFHNGNDKFAAMMWQGKLILEFGELGGMNRADIEMVKSWISRREDEYQKKGSNDVLKKPRQFISAGTTNKKSWINDTTGGKRFWPVACRFADVAGVSKVKKQLWAEAVYRYKQGEKYWLDDNDPTYQIAKDEQAARITGDDWQDILDMSLFGKKWALPRDIYEALHIDIQFLDSGKTARIRSCMEALGWEYKQAYKLSGTKSRVWVKIND